MRVIDYLFDAGVGIFANLFVMAFCYLVGMSLVPSKPARAIAGRPQMAVIGAAIIVMFFWYGFKTHHAVLMLFKILLILSLIVIGIRSVAESGRRHFVMCFTEIKFGWLIPFAFLYCIAYSILPLHGIGKYLPIVRTGNFDIFNYIILSDYLEYLNPAHFSDFSFSGPAAKPVVEFTPAIFYFVDGISAVFNGETLSAVMPALFGVQAMIGCAVLYIGRRIFRLPILPSLMLAVVVLWGPFMRYLAGAYFISTLIGSALLLLALIRLIDVIQKDKRFRVLDMTASIFPYYVIIFYSYPPLLVVAISIHSIFISLFAIFFGGRIGSIRQFFLIAPERIWNWLSAVVISVVIIAILDPVHFKEMFGFLIYISKIGIAGWPLPLISPLSVMGLPVAFTQTFDFRGMAELALFALLVIGMCYAMMHWLIRNQDAAARAICGLALANFVLYFGYFLYAGPSYQQWKVASYFPLTTGFCFLAVLASILEKYFFNKKRKLMASAIIGILILIVTGNVIDHIRHDPVPQKLTINYKNLTALDHLDGVDGIYFKMSDVASTFLPIYYIKTKVLHLIGVSYYPQEKLDWTKVTRKTPYFEEGAQCANQRSTLPITGLGCLYFDMPSVESGRLYEFNRDIPGIVKFDGVSGAESWGRWSDSNTVDFDFMISADAFSGQGKLYLNMDVQPYLFKSIDRQEFSITIGKNIYKYVLKNRGVISIPLERSDLSGPSGREVDLKIIVPNPVIPHEIDKNQTDTRKLGLGFISLSIGVTPAGLVSN